MKNRRQFHGLLLSSPLVLYSSRQALASDVSPIVQLRNISAFSPRARSSIVQAILSARTLFEKNKVSSQIRLQHFFTQIATETGGLVRLDENLNYTAEGLLKYFKKRVTPEEATALAGKPIQIANHVYANRLGNGSESSGDGWKYRGSGYMQLTGRSNFKMRGQELHLPFEEDPEIVREPATGLQAAMSYWTNKKINNAADRDALEQVRYLVNGGKNGMDHALIWRARARRTLTASPPTGAPSALGDLDRDELLGISMVLTARGFLPPAAASMSVGEITDGLKQFQEGAGLPTSGLLDEDTLYALTEPPPSDVDN